MLQVHGCQMFTSFFISRCGMAAFSFLLDGFWTWTFYTYYQDFGLVSAYSYLLSSWTPKEDPLPVGSHYQQPLFLMTANLIQNNSIVSGQTRDTVKFQSKAILGQ